MTLKSIVSFFKIQLDIVVFIKQSLRCWLIKYKMSMEYMGQKINFSFLVLFVDCKENKQNIDLITI